MNSLHLRILSLGAKQLEVEDVVVLVAEAMGIDLSDAPKE